MLQLHFLFMVSVIISRDRPIMLIFYLLCYTAVLKILTYYAQYYTHVKDLCLKFYCSIRFIYV